MTWDVNDGIIKVIISIFRLDYRLRHNGTHWGETMYNKEQCHKNLWIVYVRIVYLNL